MAQWIDGSLRCRSGKLYYCQEPADKWSYEDQPHEIEARENEQILYDLWMMSKQPKPVQKVAQGFTNRLCGAV